ncbi:EamA domain-containing membrane protein RarD [Pseudorhodobacter antarcticus]|uniref:EamA domain-containing membrane protein RarD n=3 Tax=Pseudorhodobacter antarcticus TaxID=1077947 RepID=A0A1H8LDP2_9RHOB|nr:DMT family transporter [Pseudorhodobacter antarcticus]SEO03237.1 EamA domain-containing membrane protein RarD [Pseudorhodobacter antarcticus]
MNKAFLASVIVLCVGVFWGVYWMPVRAIAALGLDGAWGTGAITLAAMLFLLPFVAGKTHLFRDTGLVGVVSIALGGAAFALYSIGFLYGKVALVVLLWFFSPVWSVLIAKFVLRWQVPILRLIAIGVGLAGLFVMLGGEGSVPVPRSLGEWMAFVGGLVWAAATAGIRLKSRVPPLPAAFIFASGATLTSLAFAPFLEPLPTIAGEDAVWVGITVLATGGLWWGLSIAGLMWATIRLDPARVGILLMPEVIFGALTAAIFAGETLSASEMIGGGLVILCGVLEVWPTKANAGHPRATKNAP